MNAVFNPMINYIYVCNSHSSIIGLSRLGARKTERGNTSIPCCLILDREKGYFVPSSHGAPTFYIPALKERRVKPQNSLYDSDIIPGIAGKDVIKGTIVQ